MVTVPGACAREGTDARRLEPRVAAGPSSSAASRIMKSNACSIFPARPILGARAPSSRDRSSPPIRSRRSSPRRATGSARPSARRPPRRRRAGRPSPRGEHTLICAPTGTGKTLAAFLWCLDRLHARASAGRAAARACASSTSRRSRRSSTTSSATCARRWRASRCAAERARRAPPCDVRVGMRTGDTPAARAARASAKRRPTSSSPRPSRSTCC